MNLRLHDALEAVAVAVEPVRSIAAEALKAARWGVATGIATRHVISGGESRVVVDQISSAIAGRGKAGRSDRSRGRRETGFAVMPLRCNRGNIIKFGENEIDRRDSGATPGDFEPCSARGRSDRVEITHAIARSIVR